MAEDAGEQLALIRQQVRRTRPTKQPPAPERPIARVAVDVPLAHLDRPFDYVVPEKFHISCVPGCRVRVRFGGQDLDGYVLERVAESEHTGRLTPLRRVVSAEPVLAPEVARLCRLVADRYAGTLADVLRLAVPPRHARVENAAPAREPDQEPFDLPKVDAEVLGCWQPYASGQEFVAALRRGDHPRAVWTALPGEDWARSLATAAAVALESGRGALLVVPDHRDVARLEQACTSVLGAGRYAAMTAELGPAERYRRFLSVRRGEVGCVIGTRSAMFAPVRRLGLVACWDDGDDLHAEPRAPYPHVREVLLLRAHAEQAAAIIGGHACTAEAAQLLSSGWAGPLRGERAAVRERAPRVFAVGESEAELARDPAARSVRLPHKAFDVARRALQHGPVLVQVPRRGYVPALACQSCRVRVRCAHCSGPLQVGAAGSIPSCGWCARPAADWRCPHCGGTRLRAPVVGAARTAEELGRAFPRVPVRTSGGSRVLPEVGPEPALVVATPGAEPFAAQGYAACLLLDTRVALGRADLRAGEEALRRWLASAALVRPAGDGGTVVVVADPSVPEAQALIRWSPVSYAERELADRQAAGFPPAVRLATVQGDPAAVNDVAALTRAHGLPSSAEVLGPVPVHDEASHGGGPELAQDPGSQGADADVRLVIRAARTDGTKLAAALKAAQAIRSARKAPGTARVRVDPHQVG